MFDAALDSGANSSFYDKAHDEPIIWLVKQHPITGIGLSVGKKGLFVHNENGDPLYYYPHQEVAEILDKTGLVNVKGIPEPIVNGDTNRTLEEAIAAVLGGRSGRVDPVQGEVRMPRVIVIGDPNGTDILKVLSILNSRGHGL